MSRCPKCQKNVKQPLHSKCGRCSNCCTCQKEGR
jgi:hypothetical protein